MELDKEKLEIQKVLDHIYERGEFIYKIINEAGKDPSYYDLMCFAIVCLIAARSTLPILDHPIKEIVGLFVDVELAELRNKNTFDQNGILKMKGN